MEQAWTRLRQGYCAAGAYSPSFYAQVNESETRPYFAIWVACLIYRQYILVSLHT
jgi:hypothetical protein